MHETILIADFGSQRSDPPAAGVVAGGDPYIAGAPEVDVAGRPGLGAGGRPRPPLR